MRAENGTYPAYPAYPEFEQDAGANSGPSFDQLDLQHYLRTLRKFRFPIVAFSVACTALAGYYAYTATPIFQATSTLLIEEQKANVISIEELVGVDSGNEDYYQTQYELLKSRSLAALVIADMNLWDDPLFAPGPEASTAPAAGRDANASKPESAGNAATDLFDRVRNTFESMTGDQSADSETVVADSEMVEPSVLPYTGAPAGGTADSILTSDADGYGNMMTGNGRRQAPRVDSREARVVSAFLNRLSIEPVRKTKLVKISFESPDPEQAARIANAVAENYITSHLAAKMAMTTQASSWLADRVGQLQGVLDESEQRLINYKIANGLVDVDGSVGRLNEQEILLLTTELSQARNDLSDTNDLYREIRSIGDQPKLLENLPAIQANGIVQSVKIEQGSAQRQLDELLNRYGDNHPRVIDARSVLGTLDQTLAKTISRVVGGIENDYRLKQQRVASLEQQIRAGKNVIQGIGSKKFELDSLQREVDTNRDLYNQFFSRMTEARSAGGLESANARVSDYAQVPDEPVKPNKQLIVALAALASLVMSMLMAILYEQMDDSVSNTRDVEKDLGLPLLGILPLVKGKFLGKKDAPLNPLDIKDPKNTFKEAVNTVRTAILGIDHEHSPQVILVTSSVPGEGKSTAAISLAYSLSRVEKVLLIDCDLRKPTVGRVLGLDRETPGLANFITGRAEANAVVQRGVFDGAMDAIPSGPSPDQPLELLSSPRFARMIEKLREHYDRIVIDSAPTQAVSDAIVLSRLADTTVYAIKSHETGMDLARRGLQRLRAGGATIAGAVVTQVDIDKLSTYGGDYHYQGYYDYYGYGGSKDGQKEGVLRLRPEELRELRTDPGENFELGSGFEGDGQRDRRRGADVRSGTRDDDFAPPDRARRPLRAAGVRRTLPDDLDIV